MLIIVIQDILFSNNVNIIIINTNIETIWQSSEFLFRLYDDFCQSKKLKSKCKVQKESYQKYFLIYVQFTCLQMQKVFYYKD